MIVPVNNVLNYYMDAPAYTQRHCKKMMQELIYAIHAIGDWKLIQEKARYLMEKMLETESLSARPA